MSSDLKKEFADESPLDLLKLLVTCQSVTPDSSNCQKEIASRLATLGFKCEDLAFASKDYGKPVHNLWATLGDAPYFVFCGHTDVVPPGDETLWTHPPFEPTVKDDNIYGRGTVDMKGSIAAMLIAMRDYITDAPPTNSSKAGTSASASKKSKNPAEAEHRLTQCITHGITHGIAFLITGDEEGEATAGVKSVLEELAKRNIKISQCLVGEPTCETKFGDTIKNGRRGSLRLVAKLSGAQRHNAYISKEENLLHRVVDFANLLLAEDWDKDIQTSSPGTAFNIINLEASSAAENVTAQQVSLLCNWRYTPQLEDKLKELKNKVEQMIRTSDFHIVESQDATAEFVAKLSWTKGAHPYYCEPQSLVDNLQAAIKEVAGTDATVNTAGGTSDGRFFPQYGVEVAEFGPRNASLHCVDENLSATELDQLTTTYIEFLRRHLI